MDWELINARRLRGELCDFEIRVEDEAFKVHRLVLDTKSEYFRTMFGSNTLEAHQHYCIEPDITSRAAKACIDYMYTGKFELEQTSVIDTLQAAHKWKLEEGVRKCEKFFKQNVSLESCIVLLNLSSFYDLNDLSKECHEFVMDNLKEMTKSEDLSKLDETEIFALVNSERGQDVTQLWELCVEWCGRSSEGRLCRIVPNFPVEKFSISCFRDIVWEDGHVSCCEIYKKNAAERFLAMTKDVNLDAKNSLFLKKISKTYGFSRQEKAADEYIMQNLEEVTEFQDFLEVDWEDFKRYCDNSEDFEVPLITRSKWLKHDDSRHHYFADVFEVEKYSECLEICDSDDEGETVDSDDEGETCDSDDEGETVDSDGEGETCDSDGEGETCDSDDEGVTIDSDDEDALEEAQHIIFLKSLAKKFGRQDEELMLDRYMVYLFRFASRHDEFKGLTSTDMFKYLSDPTLYRTDEAEIWNAVEIWIGHDPLERTKDFPKLLQAMQLEKFSTKFLGEKVIKSALIKDDNACLRRMVEVLLHKISRIEDLEDRVSKMEEHLRNARTTDNC